MQNDTKAGGKSLGIIYHLNDEFTLAVEHHRDGNDTRPLLTVAKTSDSPDQEWESAPFKRVAKLICDKVKKAAYLSIYDPAKENRLLLERIDGECRKIRGTPLNDLLCELIECLS